MLNIKEKIEFWQGMYSNEFCCSQKEIDDSAAELELVLFAIETLTNIEVK
jgi:hypothetical protein